MALIIFRVTIGAVPLVVVDKIDHQPLNLLVPLVNVQGWIVQFHPQVLHPVVFHLCLYNQLPVSAITSLMSYLHPPKVRTVVEYSLEKQHQSYPLVVRMKHNILPIAVGCHSIIWINCILTFLDVFFCYFPKN